MSFSPFSKNTSNLFVRNLNFFQYLEHFLVSAVLAILIIRLFLDLTGYPQLEGNGLHIAHMLWGGFLMLAAIFLLLTCLGLYPKKISAILAGLGFGTFIDELGKFITSDNNYFYQPTFSLIYIMFILLYFMFYFFRKSWKFSPKEYLINSFEYLKEAVILDLDNQEKKQAIDCLTHSNPKDNITQALKELYQKLDTIPSPKPNFYTKVKTFFSNLYFQLVGKRWFGWVINFLFISQAVVGLILVAISTATVFAIFTDFNINIKEVTDNSIGIYQLLGETIAGIFVIFGVFKIRSSKIKAYSLFKVSILISLLVVQPFSFYQDQLNAVGGVMLDLLVLITLNYMINKENKFS